MNNNLKMFCLTLDPSHEKFIREANYVPVGLGEKIFPSSFFTDNKGKNISIKNRYYGEYTFHYWLWKNYLNQISDNWIGFCQYRKFWSLNFFKTKKLILTIYKSKILKKFLRNSMLMKLF